MIDLLSATSINVLQFVVKVKKHYLVWFILLTRGFVFYKGLPMWYYSYAIWYKYNIRKLGVPQIHIPPELLALLWKQIYFLLWNI